MLTGTARLYRSTEVSRRETSDESRARGRRTAEQPAQAQPVVWYGVCAPVSAFAISYSLYTDSLSLATMSE